MRAVDREAVWLKAMQRIGEFVESLGQLPVKGVPEDTELKGFNVRLPTEERPDALIVLKASGEGGAFVAFMGGLTLAQAILGWRAEHVAGKIRWRVDVPWGER